MSSVSLLTWITSFDSMVTVPDWLIKLSIIFHLLIWFSFTNSSSSNMESKSSLFVSSLPVQSRCHRSWVMFFPLLLFQSLYLKSQLVHVLSLVFPLSLTGFSAKETAVQISVYRGGLSKTFFLIGWREANIRFGFKMNSSVWITILSNNDKTRNQQFWPTRFL